MAHDCCSTACSVFSLDVPSEAGQVFSLSFEDHNYEDHTHHRPATAIAKEDKDSQRCQASSQIYTESPAKPRRNASVVAKIRSPLAFRYCEPNAVHQPQLAPLSTISSCHFLRTQVWGWPCARQVSLARTSQAKHETICNAFISDWHQSLSLPHQTRRRGTHAR